MDKVIVVQPPPSSLADIRKRYRLTRASHEEDLERTYVTDQQMEFEGHALDDVRDLLAVIDPLERRCGRLEATLEFYADPKNWINQGEVAARDEDGIPCEWDEIPQSSACADDRGETARAALAGTPLPGTAGRIERLEALVGEAEPTILALYEKQIVLFDEYGVGLRDDWRPRARAELEGKAPDASA